MRKYLMTGVAALAVCAAFTSCSKGEELYDEGVVKGISTEQAIASVYNNYNEAFIKTFGQPAANQDWGFGSSSRAFTRTIYANNGDAYDKFPSAGDVAAYFPTSIPTDAKTDEEIEAEWKGKNAVDENGNEIIADWGGPVTMWDLYAVYLNMVGKVINNIKVTTPGEFVVGHSWANPADRVYNVYINVGDGNNLTLKRNGAEHVNFYIMSGNVTIDSNFGECGGIISVAEGATVNDQRTHIAHNDGVKVFNKGTYNATNTTPYWNGVENTSVFDIGNFCTFYNEGKFNCSGGMSYSPGDVNDSYFVNMGDKAELTAASMTLNSTGNFFNSGKATITGGTNVTQARLYWVNDGYYETGTMTFSAKNTTFYNYCQLIVKGNAHMYDGEFNLMENSYTEAGTAEFDNFIVNMGSNTGMHVKGTVKFEAQGDGTYQGYRTEGNNDYLLIDGKVTVACHKNTFSISRGITYSINQIEIVRGGAVVTEAQLLDEKSGDYPVLDLKGTECPYGKLTVTPPSINSCGATWKKEGDSDWDIRIMAEDLNAAASVEEGDPEDSDWDFNDVVIDVKFTGDNTAKIRLVAAGGTLPLRINGDNSLEVHDLFGVDTDIMVNTGAEARFPRQAATVTNLPVFDINCTGVKASNGKNIKLEVQKILPDGTPKWFEMEAKTGQPAAKFAVKPEVNPLVERQHIDFATDHNFSRFVQEGLDFKMLWW